MRSVLNTTTTRKCKRQNKSHEKTTKQISARSTEPKKAANLVATTKKVSSVDKSPQCPVIPNIRQQLQVIEEKCNDVIDTGIDFYVANVNNIATVEEFASGLKERLDRDRADLRKAVRDGINNLKKSTGINDEDFRVAYYNGGFMQPTLSCYNQVISQLRLTEEKTKSKVDSASDQLVELFEYYMKRKKAGNKKKN
jgi:hypothetical protein